MFHCKHQMFLLKYLSRRKTNEKIDDEDEENRAIKSMWISIAQILDI